MVSIHVPAHAEPPDLVISTLDRLAKLDYPSFEVLVIDNNTTDPELWEPVQRHCAGLGPRFRFLHVEGITGAKAGALNWALPRTDPAAELIAVVDADYHVEPDWLAHTVGFFDDPALGFVQCPHAYRDYRGSRFGRMANTEYAVFFATSMVALSEHGAGLTVGTMSLIRAAALVEVGGWAEWCLTEDSELAIRLHAADYRSIYLSRPYGRGLIPETFAGYKKQRFRWTYGPVQELRHHARLFGPRRWRTGSALNGRQRLHHANHGLDIAMIGLRLFVVPVGMLAVVSMIVHHEVVPLPGPLWAAATSVLVASWTMRWLVYRRAVRASLREALGATVAYFALSHVISVASVLASLGRSAAWQRTNKFRVSLSGRAVLRTALSELTLGLACLALAAATLIGFPHRGLTLALALGSAWQGLTYLAAPVLAVVAERDVRRQIVTTPDHSTDAELFEAPV
jgi:glycosyltransferase involved in cell wall biosynthesis